MDAKLGAITINSMRLAMVLLIFGIASLALSIFLESQILAFIGLGLTFWGALFILITPQKHVDGDFLEITSVTGYKTLDRVFKDLKPKEAYFIPPYPKDVYLPDHLRGLKEMVMFIPAEETAEMASIEELAKGKFQIENPKGVLLTPPGLGLVDKIEQKRNTDLTKINLSDLAETLPHLLNELNLTKEITMTMNQNQEISIQVVDSLFKNLYGQKYGLRSVKLIGCPIVNAAACAIAKSAGKSVAIQNIKTSSDGLTTNASFRIVQS